MLDNLKFQVGVLQFLFAVILSQNYDLQIGLAGMLTSSNVTVARSLIGESVSIVCSSDRCLIDAQLEWLDGRVPIRDSWLGNRALERTEITLTLHIYNFTVENYGQYRCRCVKDYSHPPLLSPVVPASLNDLIGISRLADYNKDSVLFCHDEEYHINLLPENYLIGEDDLIQEYFVNKNTRTVQLECVSGIWTIWKASSIPRFINGSVYNITVDRSPDQAKVTCLDKNETLHKIFYISIKGYYQFPLGFNRPLNSGDSIAANYSANFNSFATPFPAMCMGQPSLQLYNADISLMINGTMTADNYGVQITKDTDLWSIILHPFSPVDIATFYRYSNFSCVATSDWEPPIEVNFRMIKYEPDLMFQSFISSTPRPCSGEEIRPSPSSSIAIEPKSTTSLTATFSFSTSLPSIPYPLPSSSSNQLLSTSPPRPLLLPSSADHVPYSHVLSDDAATTSSKQSEIIMQSVVTTTIRGGKSGGQDSAKTIILYVAVGVSFLCVIGIVFLLMGYVWLRKKKKRTFNKHSNSIITELLKNINLPPLDIDIDSHLSKQLARCKRELEGSQWAFPYEQLQLGEDLGSGAFGKVMKAIALGSEPNQSSLTVAVKMLKDVRSDEDEKDLISELKLLQHVGAHPNIVSLMGACVHEGNLHVIVEFCEKGSLLHYLRSKRSGDRLNSSHLVTMANQVALGMEYLTSRKCIHRDLAARNVLVSDDLVLKVADFGLARKLYQSIYRPSGGRVPIKWMAPETILDREYTAQSDVWSFGVLLWEIMTLGRAPYPGKSPEQVIECIGEGYRMPTPDHCPDEVYSVMLKCWDKSPLARPVFSQLVQITEELESKLEATEINRSMSSVITEINLCSHCAEETGEDGYISQADGDEFEDQCSSCVTCDECHCYINTETQEVSYINGTEIDNQHHLRGLESGEETHSSTGSSSHQDRTRSRSSSDPYLPILYSSNDYLPILATHSSLQYSASFTTAYSNSGNSRTTNTSSLTHTDSSFNFSSLQHTGNSQNISSLPHTLPGHRNHTVCSICKTPHKEIHNTSSCHSQNNRQSLNSYYWSNTSSLESICSECRKADTSALYYDHLLPSCLKQSPVPATEQDIYQICPISTPQDSYPAPVTPRQEQDIQWTPVHQDTNWIYPKPRKGLADPIFKKIHRSYPVPKLKIEYQNSNVSSDSGVMTMISDITFDFSSQKNSDGEETTSNTEEVRRDEEEICRTLHKSVSPPPPPSKRDSSREVSASSTRMHSGCGSPDIISPFTSKGYHNS